MPRDRHTASSTHCLGLFAIAAVTVAVPMLWDEELRSQAAKNHPSLEAGLLCGTNNKCWAGSLEYCVILGRAIRNELVSTEALRTLERTLAPYRVPQQYADPVLPCALPGGLYRIRASGGPARFGTDVCHSHRHSGESWLSFSRMRYPQNGFVICEA
ncbi:hypothetical protein VTH06DRAFT_1253 [Thermothelomyces fergusii]